MTSRPALQPAAPALSAEELQDAGALVNKKFVELKFPRVQRFRVRPADQPAELLLAALVHALARRPAG
jgi:hypothetical protein